MLSDTEHWSVISVIQNIYASLFFTFNNFILQAPYGCDKLCPGSGYTVCKHEQTHVKQNTNINTWSCLKLEATQVTCHWILATCALKSETGSHFGLINCMLLDWCTDRCACRYQIHHCLCNGNIYSIYVWISYGFFKYIICIIYDKMTIYKHVLSSICGLD